MFSTKLILLVCMAVAGSSVSAAPNPYKRGTATPALAAREPQFSVNIPNNIPVSGAFPNGITITPGTPSGSIVTGDRNSTLFGQFGFKRDDATPVLAAREPQFSVNIPNNIPVSGSFPNGINITPGTPSGSVVTSSRNGTFPLNLFGRDIESDDPRQPLSAVFRIAPSEDKVLAAHPLPVGTGTLEARDPQFSANIPNTIPVSGKFPNGISITPGTPSGSIVTGDRNSTLFVITDSVLTSTQARVGAVYHTVYQYTVMAQRHEAKKPRPFPRPLGRRSRASEGASARVRRGRRPRRPSSAPRRRV